LAFFIDVKPAHSALPQAEYSAYAYSIYKQPCNRNS